MKIFASVMLFFSLIGNANAASFEITANVTEVVGYARNTANDSDQCLVYLDNPSPTACSSKNRVVINTSKGIGDLMCTIAMTALVRVILEDIHKTPIS